MHAATADGDSMTGRRDITNGFGRPRTGAGIGAAE